jgi:hypothetical protein
MFSGKSFEEISSQKSFSNIFVPLASRKFKTEEEISRHLQDSERVMKISTLFFVLTIGQKAKRFCCCCFRQLPAANGKHKEEIHFKYVVFKHFKRQLPLLWVLLTFSFFRNIATSHSHSPSLCKLSASYRTPAVFSFF